TDLFNVEGAVREPPRLGNSAFGEAQLLQRGQHREDGEVVDRQRIAPRLVPRLPYMSALEEREPLRVEQAAAVRRDAKTVVRDPAMDRTEECEHPVPCGVRAFQWLVTRVGLDLTQLVEECRRGERPVVQIVTERKQAALFRVQQEDESHEDRDGSPI